MPNDPSYQLILETVLNSVAAGLLIVDEHGTIVQAQGAASIGFTAQPDEPVGHNIGRLLPEAIGERMIAAVEAALLTHSPQIQQYCLDADDSDGGPPRWFEARLTPLPAADRSRLVVYVCSDISRDKSLEKELEQATLIDPVTEISNQRHFMRVLDLEVARQERYQEPFCLLLLEIDHFEAIHDNYGVDTADSCLRETARLIRQQLRHSDVLGRLEGAEFGILLLNTPLQWAKEVAQRIGNRIARAPFTLPSKTLRLTMSAGVTPLREGDTASSLLWRTEEALFQSERGGHSQINVV